MKKILIIFAALVGTIAAMSLTACGSKEEISQPSSVVTTAPETTEAVTTEPVTTEPVTEEETVMTEAEPTTTYIQYLHPTNPDGSRRAMPAVSSTYDPSVQY